MTTARTGSQRTRSRRAIAVLVIAMGATATFATRARKEHAPPPPQSAKAPHVVFVTGDDEYRSEITMPMIASLLKKDGMRTSVAYAKPRPQTKDNIEGLDALKDADLMVIFTRFRELPDAQLQRILDYVGSGKPIVGLRTSTHAFNYPKGSAHEGLNTSFGIDLFGQTWITHHGHTSTTDVVLTTNAAAASHPILRGVKPFHASSWLYHVAPLAGDSNQVLLEGDSVNSEKKGDALTKYPPHQPVAWTRVYKGARVFFTTLGHPADFEQESMRRLVVNGIYWALGRDVPANGADVTVPGGFVAPESFDLSKVK